MAHEVSSQNALEPAYLQNTFFGGQRSIAVPEIPASISDPVLAPSRPPAPPPGVSVFGRPQVEANLINIGGQGGPREGKSAQVQPSGVALGQPDIRGLGAGPVPKPLLETQPLLPTPPPTPKQQFAFQPQVQGTEDVRFLEPNSQPHPLSLPRDQPQPFIPPTSPLPASRPRGQPPQFFTPRPGGPPPGALGTEEVSFLDPAPPQSPQPSRPRDQPPQFFETRPPVQPTSGQILVNAPLNAAVDGRPQGLSPNPPQSSSDNVLLGVPPQLGNPPIDLQKIRQQPLRVRPQPNNIPLGQAPELGPRPGQGSRPELRPSQDLRDGPPQFFRPRPTVPGLGPGFNQGLDQDQTRFNLTLFNLPANLRSRNQLIIDPNKLLGGFQTSDPSNQNVEFQFLGNQQNIGLPQQGLGPNRDIPQGFRPNGNIPQGLGPNGDVPQGFAPGPEIPQTFDPNTNIPTTFQSNHNIPPRIQLPSSGPPPEKPLGPGVGPAIPAVPAAQAGGLGPLGVRGKQEPLVQSPNGGGCKTTFVEECHNEYEMICEETTIEREKHQCEVIVEDVCEEGVTTEYEPACFQQIINHCEGVKIKTILVKFLMFFPFLDL